MASQDPSKSREDLLADWRAAKQQRQGSLLQSPPPSSLSGALSSSSKTNRPMTSAAKGFQSPTTQAIKDIQSRILSARKQLAAQPVLERATVALPTAPAKSTEAEKANISVEMHLERLEEWTEFQSALRAAAKTAATNDMVTARKQFDQIEQQFPLALETADYFLVRSRSEQECGNFEEVFLILERAVDHAKAVKMPTAELQKIVHATRNTIQRMKAEKDSKTDAEISPAELSSEKATAVAVAASVPAGPSKDLPVDQFPSPTNMESMQMPRAPPCTPASDFMLSPKKLFSPRRLLPGEGRPERNAAYFENHSNMGENAAAADAMPLEGLAAGGCGTTESLVHFGGEHSEGGGWLGEDGSTLDERQSADQSLAASSKVDRSTEEMDAVAAQVRMKPRTPGHPNYLREVRDNPTTTSHFVEFERIQLTKSQKKKFHVDSDYALTPVKRSARKRSPSMAGSAEEGQDNGDLPADGSLPIVPNAFV